MAEDIYQLKNVNSVPFLHYIKIKINNGSYFKSSRHLCLF